MVRYKINKSDFVCAIPLNKEFKIMDLQKKLILIDNTQTKNATRARLNVMLKNKYLSISKINYRTGHDYFFSDLNKIDVLNNNYSNDVLAKKIVRERMRKVKNHKHCIKWGEKLNVPIVAGLTVLMLSNT